MAKKDNASKKTQSEKQEEILKEFGKAVQQDPGFTITDMKDGRSRLRVQFDITYKHGKRYDPKGESMTEPDMTLRLGQLLERHSRGQHVPMKQPLYFDTEIPTFSDLTDIDRYKEQLQRRLDETKRFIKEEKEAIAEAKKQKEFKERTLQVPKQPGDQLELQDDPSYKPKAK